MYSLIKTTSEHAWTIIDVDSNYQIIGVLRKWVEQNAWVVSIPSKQIRVKFASCIEAKDFVKSL